jgi:hypothetical protein
VLSQVEGDCAADVHADSVLHGLHRVHCTRFIISKYYCTANLRIVCPLQLRRACAWVPCLDVPDAAVQFELALTVARGVTAVATGTLIKKAWADVECTWVTYHYTSPLPCAPHQLVVAAGPFRLAGPHKTTGETTVLTFGPQDQAVGADAAVLAGHQAPDVLTHTGKFAVLLLELYQEILGAKLPFPTLQQVCAAIPAFLPCSIGFSHPPHPHSFLARSLSPGS